MGYIGKHWRGDLTIQQAFWINFVALRAAFLLGDRAFQPPITMDVRPVLGLVLGYYAVNLLVVFPWQIRGLLRATDRMVQGAGSMTLSHLVNFSIVLSLFLTGVSLYSTFQPLAVDQPAEPYWVTRERDRAGRYSISVTGNGAVLEIRGAFELGLTRDLRETVRANPEIREILLDSGGGYVSQGRAVAVLIQERGLATRVEHRCESACVIAFMAGVARRLGPLGRLGFHQYRYAGRTAHPFIDIEEEHTRDRAFLLSRGVAPDFADRAFRAIDAEFWYPDRDLLLSAGVVHAVDP